MIIAFFVGAISFLVFNTIYAFIVGVFIGIISAFIYKKSNKDTTSQEVRGDKPNKDEQTLQNLLMLNIDIREALDDIELLQNIEDVIDQVRSLAPQINVRMPGSQIEWVINRMDSEYLPKLVNPYIRLEHKARIEKKSSFIAALKSIEDELQEVEKMLNNADSTEFDSKAAFIKHRFSDLY